MMKRYVYTRTNGGDLKYAGRLKTGRTAPKRRKAAKKSTRRRKR